VEHAHDPGVVIDREEDAVRLRLPPVGQYSYGAITVIAVDTADNTSPPASIIVVN
jgi:hypothetical protein